MRARLPKPVLQRRRGRAGGCAIAVMAKASSPGRTKTRLAPPLTAVEAAGFNTAFLQDMAANMILAAREAAITPVMAFGPPGTAPFFEKHLPSEIGLLETWFPNFGECLLHAVSSLLDSGFEAACVLNSDSPTLPTQILVEAADWLGQPGDRAVLGPSSDGGYYLLGIKRPHARLFEDVAWSTERVARQTLDRAAELGLPVHLLPTWYDVDDAAALRMLHAELFEGRSFDGEHSPHGAPHTGRFFRGLLADTDLASRLALPPGTSAAPMGPRATAPVSAAEAARR